MNSEEYECGDGWRNLIDTTIDMIQATDRRIVIDQVKEKMGGLRIYYHPVNADADRIIEYAEAIAAETCELCGNTVARNQKVFGYWKTMCAHCIGVAKRDR